MIEPLTEQELAQALADANTRGLAVIPQGGGSKSHWGNPPVRSDVVLSTARLNRVIEHAWADMTVTVEAGCTISNLQTTLAQHGQRLALDPLWPDRATVGGVLATNDSGALRVRFGGLRDLIIGITVALPDGTLASSGGKVVKNVAGYDLPKLMTGALGTLGVITRAVFRLHPLPRYSRTFTLPMKDLQQAQKAILEFQDSQLAHSALQLRVAPGRDIELDILFEGTEAGIEAQSAALGRTDARKQAEGLFHWPHQNPPNVKMSVLPSRIGETLAMMPGATATMQAHGIGHARLDGDLAQLRRKIEAGGGSLTILEPCGLDAWGDPGEALPLMKALKQQFDPKGTLNPGRFVGGI